MLEDYENALPLYKEAYQLALEHKSIELQQVSGIMLIKYLCGRDISINENGHFAPGGYVTKVSDDFREVYHGIQDIPAEHRVFAYPQLSIREQMAAYQEIIDGSSKEGFRRLTEKHHEER